MSKKYMIGMTLFILLGMMSACEHRPLVERTDMHYIRIYLDEHLRNVNFGFYDEEKPRPEYKTPTVMRVTLCDTETGKIVSERYLRDTGTDERGNYIDGTISAPPGTYHLMAYNFDTESTHVRDKDNHFQMQVYTNPISEQLMDRLAFVRSSNETKDWNIRYEPDHFFVETCEEIVVDDKPYADTLYNHQGDHFTAESVVKTYYIQVNVKGIEYIKSAYSLLTGMAGSVQLCNQSMIADPPASVFFHMKPGADRARESDDIAVAYATFNTFGKLKNVEGFIEVAFEFNTVFETTQVETIRLTDMFETPQVKNEQWIIIDKVIEIVPPEGASTGGLNPGLNDWDEIEGETTI